MAGLGPFTFQTATRIVFGRGMAVEAITAAKAFGPRVLLVRSASVPFADEAEERLEQALSVPVRGEPLLSGLEENLWVARDFGPDVVLAIGGGSVIDMGKAIAALVAASRPPTAYLEVVGEGCPIDAVPVPFIAVPSTAGTGAEVTKNAVIGLPEHGRKVSLRDERMLACLAVVDPALTDRSPLPVTLASGLDAVTQVIEPYLSKKANPMIDGLCRTAIPLGLRALVTLVEREDPAARDDLALTSLLGGIALANAGLGAVHGLAGVIGGRWGAPHGLICGRLLAPVLRMNRDTCRAAGGDTSRYAEVETWVGDALGVAPDDAIEALKARLDDWGLPRLSTFVGRPEDIPTIASESLSSSSMAANPVVPDVQALARVVEDAL